MIKFSNQFNPDRQEESMATEIRQEESMATEIRQYACCIDNIKAAKIFKVTNMVLESILLVPVLVFLGIYSSSVSTTGFPNMFRIGQRV